MKEKVRGEEPYKYHTKNVVTEFLAAVDRKPDEEGLHLFADQVRKVYMGHDGNKDALETCGDLALRWPDATSYWAGLVDASHPVLPNAWITNENAARTVLVMSGSIELGWLEARQASHMHVGRIPRIDNKINVLTNFVNKLKER